jgi:hypothetical protein
MVSSRFIPKKLKEDVSVNLISTTDPRHRKRIVEISVNRFILIRKPAFSTVYKMEKKTHVGKKIQALTVFMPK